jgi:chromosome partitioning protein
MEYKMRIIAIANQKGGCGKTTTAVNLAAALAMKGKRVLLLDLDSQGHATLGLGHSPQTLTRTIYDIMVNPQTPICSVTLDTKIEGLYVVPSNILLSSAEIELSAKPDREFILARQLETVNSSYDICLIDCPPGVGLLTVNALVACSEIIVPVQANYYAVEGLRQLLDVAEIIKTSFPHITGRTLKLLLTFMEDRLLLCRQIKHQICKFFGSLVFETVIHRSVRLAEAPSAGQSVMTYAPGGIGAAEYSALAEEIIKTENYQILAQQQDFEANQPMALAEEMANGT